jgi:hypothetical protein
MKYFLSEYNFENLIACGAHPRVGEVTLLWDDDVVQENNMGLHLLFKCKLELALFK